MNVAPAPPQVLHASLIAGWGVDGWRGVLLRGASGVGKSDLVLRAMAAGWRLVADDRTLVWTSGGRLFGRAPNTLAGLMEARHLGVGPRPALPYAELALVVDGVVGSDDLDRTPMPATARLLQVDLPRVRLCVREASALDKVSLALETGGRFDADASGRI